MTTRKATSSRLVALGGALLLAATLGGVPVTAAIHAQQVKPLAAPRTLEGHVVHDGTGVAGAIVYLKDIKSLAVRSFIADPKGEFHFGQLSPDGDYEVWAEHKGQRSKSKRISSFSSKSDYDFTLSI